MTIDVHLQNIAKEALETFPPHDTERGKDRGAASNYAQRLLTKHVSEIRKAGQTISDEDAQEQRQTLDNWVNSLEVTEAPDSPPKPNNDAPDNDEAENEEPETLFHIEHLGALISACFHTATDGSPKHLAVLRRRAREALKQYLSTAGLGWAEKRHLKSKGKRLIDMHMKDISTGSGTTGNGTTGNGDTG